MHTLVWCCSISLNSHLVASASLYNSLCGKFNDAEVTRREFSEMEQIKGNLEVQGGGTTEPLPSFIPWLSRQKEPAHRFGGNNFF